MALLEIEKAGAPILKQICDPVKKIDGKLRSFLDDMAETMYKSDGIGLAAPQVGERSEKVTVDYTTRYGKRRKLEADGLLARCIQHELDHLNGILFIDVAKNLRQETPEP